MTALLGIVIAGHPNPFDDAVAVHDPPPPDATVTSGRLPLALVAPGTIVPYPPVLTESPLAASGLTPALARGGVEEVDGASVDDDGVLDEGTGSSEVVVVGGSSSSVVDGTGAVGSSVSSADVVGVTDVLVTGSAYAVGASALTATNTLAAAAAHARAGLRAVMPTCPRPLLSLCGDVGTESSRVRLQREQQGL